jgi:hypothetical protein
MTKDKAVINSWSLREVYFDEDGEPSMHRSPPAAQPGQEPQISTEELVYMTGVYDGKVLEREACAKIVEDMNSLLSPEIAAAIRARGNT